MTTGIAAILERAIHHARNGERNPHRCLILAGDGLCLLKNSPPMDEAEVRAFWMVLNAIGDRTLQNWFEETNPTPEQTAALLEDVLFTVQLAG